MAKEGDFTKMSVALMVILSILTTFLNSSCMVIITKSKTLMKRPSTLLILNLLAVHLFQGLFVFPFYTAKKMRLESLLSRQVVCDGFRFTYMTSFYASVMAVFLVTIDRLIATRFVLRYREIVSKKRIKLMILLAWIYVLVLCSLPFEIHDKQSTTQIDIDTTNTTNGGANRSLMSQWRTAKVCHYNQSQEWTIGMLVANCAVPYSLIIVFYCRILSQINVIQLKTERSRSLTTTNLTATTKCDHSPVTSTLKDKEQKQLHDITRMCVIIGIAYLFLWLPSVIYYVVFRACPDCFAEELSLIHI